jgi:hypothetical protein
MLSKVSFTARLEVSPRVISTAWAWSDQELKPL